MPMTLIIKRAALSCWPGGLTTRLCLRIHPQIAAKRVWLSLGGPAEILRPRPSYNSCNCYHFGENAVLSYEFLGARRKTHSNGKEGEAVTSSVSQSSPWPPPGGAFGWLENYLHHFYCPMFTSVLIFLNYSLCFKNWILSLILWNWTQHLVLYRWSTSQPINFICIKWIIC